MRDVGEIPGHKFSLDIKTEKGIIKEAHTFSYFCDGKIHGIQHAQGGPMSQEVLRSVIARTKALNEEKFHSFNSLAIKRLEEAILLLEMRAMDRKLEKNLFVPSRVFLGEDGHFVLVGDAK